MAANIWNVKIKEMLAFGDDETINTVYYHINVDLLNSDHAWRIFTDEDMGKVPVLDYPSTHTLLKELQAIPGVRGLVVSRNQITIRKYWSEVWSDEDQLIAKIREAISRNLQPARLTTDSYFDSDKD